MSGVFFVKRDIWKIEYINGVEMKKNTFITILIGMIVIIALFTWLESIGMKSDVISNTVGTLAGGVLSILFVFWQLKMEKQRRAKQDIVNLLNLIDEFPSLVSEDYLKNYLREITDATNRFDAVFEMLNPYLNELHKAIDQAETSLILLSDSNQNLKNFLQCSNIVQIDLREFIQEARECKEAITCSRDKRINAARRLEKKKSAVIRSMKKLIDVLKNIGDQEKSLQKIDFEGITEEVYLFAEGYNQVYQKLLELIDTDVIKLSQVNEKSCYRQGDFTKQVDVIAPIIEKYHVKLPETVDRYYENKEDIRNKYKNVIQQVLLYKALDNKADFIQLKYRSEVGYLFK